MSTGHLQDADRPAARNAPGQRTTVLGWYAVAAALFFAVPFVGTDRLGLQPDAFYLGYFTIALAFLAAFLSSYAAELRGLWTPRWWQSLAVGGVVGAALAVGISRQDGVAHAEGWRYAFEVVWRGVVYGTADALTLFVFPAAVAYLVMRGDRSGVKRRTAFAGLTLALSMVVTATYHLGYSEFRDGTIRNPEIGAVMANIPTALTGNPVGAVAAHTTMHVAAVVHQRDGGEQHMLPPRVDAAYPDHGSDDLAAGLAVCWLVAAAAASALVLRRRPR
ncbi:MAG TPA: hypothetical protein VD864_01375 [Nocardioides sp.]|nr:hypothetical protein [Nocardioides sp.]